MRNELKAWCIRGTVDLTGGELLGNKKLWRPKDSEMSEIVSYNLWIHAFELIRHD